MKVPSVHDEPWIHNLPASRIKAPTRVSHRAKYLLWRAVTPMHPKMRRAVEKAGLRSASFVKHETPGRQRFLLGRVAPTTTVRKLVEHLVSLGYGNHFLAWRDESQVVSLRLLEGFSHQYHIRIFTDGEVRGHYEFTPECHPLRHLLANGQLDRRDVFYKHLGDFLVRAEE